MARWGSSSWSVTALAQTTAASEAPGNVLRTDSMGRLHWLLEYMKLGDTPGHRAQALSTPSSAIKSGGHTNRFLQVKTWLSFAQIAANEGQAKPLCRRGSVSPLLVL